MFPPFMIGFKTPCLRCGSMRWRRPATGRTRRQQQPQPPDLPLQLPEVSFSVPEKLFSRKSYSAIDCLRFTAWKEKCLIITFRSNLKRRQSISLFFVFSIHRPEMAYLKKRGGNLIKNFSVERLLYSDLMHPIG